ncbi:venom factor-like isoform X2 [Aquarana catesbeiana]|uniref:venom factor-like isoform X2 n=1 Tax=Aquarana catesbeiana TaxID=8400 RepID=UPI003CC9D62C
MMMGCRVVCLLLLALLAGAYAQLCMLITPNVLHLESEETIVVDGQTQTFDAVVEIQDFPQRRLSLAKQRVSINRANKFLGKAVVTIPSKDLLKDRNENQFVYVTIKSPVCSLEKVIMLGHQSRYVFIQTDKTIYTPGSTVHYRIFKMNYKMSPINETVIVEFLTPENIIVKRDTVKQDSASGILSLSYKLPELVSVGTWTITTRYKDSPLQNYTENFEVKEYVLPTLEIQLIPNQRFFYFDDQEFVVDLRVRYLYGKEVHGSAFVLFGVAKDGVKTSFPNTLRRIQINNGDGTVTLERSEFVKNFKEEDDMLQFSLYMSVTVVTDSGSEMLEAELENIHIVKSRYKIFFTKTSKYFKPGMPFDLTVFVTNPDGSPANRIKVVAQPGKVEGLTGPEGTSRLTLNTAANINRLQITVKTSWGLSAEREASATMTAVAYNSNGNYLHIGITTSKVKPGDNLNVTFNIRNTNAAVQNQITHFTYVIMNKGRVLKVDRQQRLASQALVTMNIPITVDYIPSFRLIAYYIVGNDIVSDSIWVNVADTCIGMLEVTGYTDRDKKVQSPGSSMKLKLKADHKASVGMVAVDKGVYVLNSKYKISQSKVWNSVEKSDLGCTPGSGADNMGVFYDAGVAFQSSTKATTELRSEPQCVAPVARKRRSTAQLIELQNSYASRYEEPIRQCCKDGMWENPMGHSCEIRATHIAEDKTCVDAFLDCCTYIEKKKLEEKYQKDVDILGRSNDDDDYIQDIDIVSRSEFPESWFWKIEIMNETPDKDGISSKVLNVLLKDSITTWEVFAVSLSENKGLCIAKPYEIQVMKDFFIDLKLPYSVVRNEQVEIRAILFNYANARIKVKVEFTHNPEFCSLSTSEAKYRRDIFIEPHSSYAVPFIIVPLSLGLHDVEVKAAVFQQFFSDGIKKKLKVVPEGVRLTKNIKTVTLEPQVKGQGTITQMVEDAINGSNLTPLIVEPRGNGESNMITMTPNVIATIYLDATNQWKRIGFNRREEAIKNIRTGYVQQLVYRKADNSYAAFVGRPASTWLTAYVAKVFAMARPLMDIEVNVLCGAIKWLILEKENKDGLFKEDAPVIHQEMIGGFKGSKESDVALTAFVLIAMLESEEACNAHVNSLRLGIKDAASFLLSQYPNLEKPYSVAIATYALAKAGSINNTSKLMSVSKDKTHWNEPGARFISLEGTAYALLALLQLKEYEGTGDIVRWLTEQRYFGAVYESTQATIVMFQALAQYQIDMPNAVILDMNVSIHLPKRPLNYHINVDNAGLARFAQTQLNKKFEVTAKGKGQGTLTVMSVYHAILTEKEQQCKNFHLTIEVKEEQYVKRPEGAISTISFEICARFLKDQDATMSIIDISMMTGFAPDVESLSKLSKPVDKYISKFEINKGATEKSTLLLYLDKISHKHRECVKFYAHQIFKVGLVQPASVTVYDYYAPENRCTKFYHFEEGSKLLGTICQADVCRCAEANCFLQQQLEGQLDAQERMERACGQGVDYVYRARIDKVEPNDNYDNYVMTIVKAIRIGTDEKAKGKQRNFVSHNKCRNSLDLQKGREYLIWGVWEDLWDQPDGYSYIIGKDTWIEWWPNNRECQEPENEEICDIFFLLSEYLELNGCAS